MSVDHRPMFGESGYARNEHDAYWTPAWCTEVLLDAFKFRGPIWEPACGKGNISEVLKARGYEVISSDIANHGYGTTGKNFLAGKGLEHDGSIITNPPYDKATEFIDRALWSTHLTHGMVAMLLRNEFDSASSRVRLFDGPPFHSKLVLTKRPRWSENDKASPRHNFAWFIWDWQHAGPASLRYQAAK